MFFNSLIKNSSPCSEGGYITDILIIVMPNSFNNIMWCSIRCNLHIFKYGIPHLLLLAGDLTGKRACGTRLAGVNTGNPSNLDDVLGSEARGDIP